jgi:hypothetical protein
MKIRIAMKGWSKFGPAETADEVRIGVGVPWVEVDGHRITEVVKAEIKTTEDGFQEVTVSLIGPVEIVYVGRDGEPLPGVHAQPEELPETLDWRATTKVKEA